ncbi:MAG: hypothetical protein HUJ68_02335 [Clostridia bacterium]|nr:hypothetical protein [Clostridia bacterium]
MNVILPTDTKTTKKQWIIYSIIILICIASMIIAYNVQFYGRINLFGLNNTASFGSKTDDEISNLEDNFNKVFTNSLDTAEDDYASKKQDAEKPLIYNKYKIKNSEPDNYDIDITIPYINIESEIVDSYNENIEKVFVEACRRIVTTPKTNDIYQVSYSVSIEEGILSLMIQATLKEKDSPQRLVINTYNYDLRNNKAISLNEVLRIKALDSEKVQEKIDKTIKLKEQSSQALVSAGYTAFSRNVSDEMYKIENTTEFYLSNDSLYIMYPYGNKQITNEMDLIIF